MILKKTYKSTDEFYKEIERLIVLFRQHGFETEAQKLDRLLHGVWTTGSELICELILYLETVNANLPKDIKKLKADCHYFAKHHRMILGLD